MTNKEIFTYRNDSIFKEIFMSEENKNLLIPLLELCLGIKINSIKYLYPNNNEDYFSKKYYLKQKNRNN